MSRSTSKPSIYFASGIVLLCNSSWNKRSTRESYSSRNLQAVDENMSLRRNGTVNNLAALRGDSDPTAVFGRLKTISMRAGKNKTKSKFTTTSTGSLGLAELANRMQRVFLFFLHVTPNELRPRVRISTMMHFGVTDFSICLVCHHSWCVGKIKICWFFHPGCHQEYFY